MPSKYLLHAVSVLHSARGRLPAGLDIRVERADFAEVMCKQRELVQVARKEKYEEVLAGLRNVRFVEGKASFVAPNQISVNGEVYRGEKFLICTGGRTAIPPVEGLRQVGYLTNETVFRLERLPGHIVIVGAGPMGLEFAQVFARWGSKVTVVEKEGMLLPNAEKELTVRLQHILENEGVRFLLSAQLKKVALTSYGKKEVVVEHDGAVEKIVCDELLLATGKKPNTAELNLGAAGVETTNTGAIVVDGTLRTRALHVYAAGDVVALPRRLETTAAREGTLATLNALGGSSHLINYEQVPYVVFTEPALASVGYTDHQQKERSGGRCLCRVVELGALPRAMIEGMEGGVAKFVFEPNSLRVVGVHILAPLAGELIAVAELVVRQGFTASELASCFFAFPTFAEVFKLGALVVVGANTKLPCCV